MSHIVRVVPADQPPPAEKPAARRPSVGQPMQCRPPRTSRYESMNPPPRAYPKKKKHGDWGNDDDQE
jgi:hypothetical protein